VLELYKDNSGSIDDLDIKILSLLGKDARISYREIAVKLNVARELSITGSRDE